MNVKVGGRRFYRVAASNELIAKGLRDGCPTRQRRCQLGAHGLLRPRGSSKERSVGIYGQRRSLLRHGHVYGLVGLARV